MNQMTDAELLRPRKCTDCGRTVSAKAACPSCGALLPLPGVKRPRTPRSDDRQESWDEARDDPSQAYTDEHPVYREAFVAFDKNDGQWVMNWSWVGLLFGGFWYIYKGLWAKLALLFAIAILTGGWGWILVGAYTGMYGKYDYYLLKVHKKQWGWKRL